MLSEVPEQRALANTPLPNYIHDPRVGLCEKLLVALLLDLTPHKWILDWKSLRHAASLPLYSLLWLFVANIELYVVDDRAFTRTDLLVATPERVVHAHARRFSFLRRREDLTWAALDNLGQFTYKVWVDLQHIEEFLLNDNLIVGIATCQGL